MRLPRIIVSSGEPAGVGPELALRLAPGEWPALLVVAADRELLEHRARQTGTDVELVTYDPRAPAPPRPGRLAVLDVPLRADALPGRLDARNAPYVLEILERAVAGCLEGEFDALVTAPLHKGIINEAGIAFTGHTEYLADATHAGPPVMLLVGDTLRVALATTHLPLSCVAAAITPERLTATLAVLDEGLKTLFGIAAPRISVCGLNPHAGEGGHLGREEIEVIIPVLEALQGRGMNLVGPLPADTAFTPPRLGESDAVLAMYHDQGLPVLKALSFGRAVNVTLGLPILRTSVDHGTALDLAGSGTADPGSLEAAVTLAIELARRQRGRM